MRTVGRGSWAGAVGLAFLALAAAGVGPAGATYRGSNGLIAFTAYRNGAAGDQIYVMHPDGSGVRQLTTSLPGNSQANFAPDGKLVVFEANFPANPGRYLMTMWPDGSHLALLTKPNRFRDDGEPDFSPNGRRIAFERTRYTKRGLNTEIIVMRRDGTRLKHVLRARFPTEVQAPRFSPNGREIVFLKGSQTRNELFAMRPDGTHVRRLTHDRRFHTDLCFSPSGKKIAFSSYVAARPGQTKGLHLQVFVANANGSHVDQLTHTPSEVSNSGPTFSPDGKRILFDRLTSTSNQSYVEQLVLMNPDGSAQQPIVSSVSPERNFSPAWQSLR